MLTQSWSSVESLLALLEELFLGRLDFALLEVVQLQVVDDRPLTVRVHIDWVREAKVGVDAVASRFFNDDAHADHATELVAEPPVVHVFACGSRCRSSRRLATDLDDLGATTSNLLDEVTIEPVLLLLEEVITQTLAVNSREVRVGILCR